ncbi:MAG: hypothetical protein ACRDQY_25440 [Pseudonocardiaceae bacterium]
MTEQFLIAAGILCAGFHRGIYAQGRPLRQTPLTENAMGRQAQALLATLDVECANADQLSAVEAFQQHPVYRIITSFPGLGDTTGARLLTKIGDDRSRFADPES